MEQNLFVSKAAPAVPFVSSWKAPSNIALVKYWGKSEPQLPKNPSLSFTLSTSVTETKVNFQPATSGTFDFYFHGEKRPDFNPKIQHFIDRITPYIPWITNYHLVISSENSFPHSSGIASSASAMAALSLNLMDLEQHLFPTMEKDYFHKKASFLARLGSGSAARSIEGPVTIWGKTTSCSTSSELYAVPFGSDLHPIFESYRDAILLVDHGSKVVSSTQGHQLMHKHPYAEKRFSQAAENLNALLPIMRSGDLDAFIKIVELEALSLHAMMMTSTPYFVLFKPNTLAIIEKIWEYRAGQKVPVCFTLDAGANVHVLYPAEYASTVEDFINKELAVFCEQGKYLLDRVGTGAKKM
jgi:diphosphomevalonate decarboxylase